MSHIPTELRYTTTHEWVKEESNGTFTVGITDYAQNLLGDVVYIELPEVSRAATAGNEIAVIESVKAAADVYSPLSGEIIARNERLSAEPQLVNASPYEEGWLFQIKSSDAIKDLLDAEAYQAHVK
jgi:glycine cleavage system H protein